MNKKIFLIHTLINVLFSFNIMGRNMETRDHEVQQNINYFFSDSLMNYYNETKKNNMTMLQII